MVNRMNGVLLLLLLGCFGGFGCGDSATPYVGNGGCGQGTAPGNGNNIRSGNSGLGNDCGCPDNVAPVTSGSGSCDGDDGISTVSGGPSHWQDYPGIPGRENNCDCEN